MLRDDTDARGVEHSPPIEVEETEGGTTILYAPDGVPHNFYDDAADIVVLDARLKENQTAHEIVRDHELQHARNGYDSIDGFVSNLLLELRTDYWRWFSMSEEAQELRDFFDSREYPRESWKERLSSKVINLLRFIWTIPGSTIGPVYRMVRRWLDV